VYSCVRVAFQIARSNGIVKLGTGISVRDVGGASLTRRNDLAVSCLPVLLKHRSLKSTSRTTTRLGSFEKRPGYIVSIFGDSHRAPVSGRSAKLTPTEAYDLQPFNGEKGKS
jgi:hypothetical protein